MPSRLMCSLCCVLIACTAGAADRPPPPMVFVDQPFIHTSTLADGEHAYQLQTLTINGIGPERSGTVTVADGALAMTPLCEGIHILSIDGEERARFLAMAVPPVLDAAALRQTLPRQADGILGGQPVRVLAMGDSVTDTGHYIEILAAMLRRAAANDHIVAQRAAYSGRSIDASVRHFHRDINSLGVPQVALIMYGLNDQAAHTPVSAYLEQYRWLHHQLSALGTDCLFLEPTPHIEIAVDGQPEKKRETPPSYAFRTLVFGALQRQLAGELAVPQVPTFHAIWHANADSIEHAARAMWPLYPPHYSKQMQSMEETGGAGDTIHPNALGHLAMAKAVYARLNGMDMRLQTAWSGRSWWADGRLHSELRLSNASKRPLVGRVELYFPDDWRAHGPVVADYALAPGDDTTVAVVWPEEIGSAGPVDRAAIELLAHPLHLVVFDICDGGGRPVAVPVPLERPAAFPEQRLLIDGDAVAIDLRVGNDRQQLTIPLPADATHHTQELRQTGDGWLAIGQLQATRVAAAHAGEIDVDGQADDWAGTAWMPLDEDPAVRWACRVGATAFHLAIDAPADFAADGALVFLDPRPAEERGTAGPYYWFTTKMGDDGRVQVRRGETTDGDVRADGRWQLSAERCFIECSIPYGMMNSVGWPADGELGFSLMLRHHYDGEERSRWVRWAEFEHMWNSRNYGLIRLVDDPQTRMPWRVRVR